MQAIHPEAKDSALELLLRYMSHGRGPFSSELHWYFKPWRSSRTRPREKGVYATVHGAFHGFSYYAADIGKWLMSFDNAQAAQRHADSFYKDYKAGAPNAVETSISWHQNKQWSEAPLAGIDQMPSWCLRDDGRLFVNDEALTLGLLRYAVDPKMRRAGP